MEFSPFYNLPIWVSGIFLIIVLSVALEFGFRVGLKRREHCKDADSGGAPDGIVVNVTKDSIWVREGILPDYPTTRLPDYPNSRAPQFDFTNGQLVVPKPPTSREEIQEPFVRKQEIDPSRYYPKGYHRELLEEWPVDSDLVVPFQQLPVNLKESMSGVWSLMKKNQQAIEEKNKQ